MQFVDNLAWQTDTRPASILPVKGMWIDDHRRTVRPLRLEARTGIGIMLVPIESISVKRSNFEMWDDAGEIPSPFWREREPLWTVPFDCYFYTLVFRRPNPEADAVSKYFCSQIKVPGALLFAHGFFSRRFTRAQGLANVIAASQNNHCPKPSGIKAKVKSTSSARWA